MGVVNSKLLAPIWKIGVEFFNFFKKISTYSNPICFGNKKDISLPNQSGLDDNTQRAVIIRPSRHQ